MNPLKVTINHKTQSQQKEVNKELFTVGRSLDCDIHLNDNSISRVHVVVTVRGSKVYIEDKSSSNGTFLNGQEIERGVPVQVAARDQIRLGTSEYILFLSPPREEKESLAAVTPPHSERSELDHTKDIEMPKVPSVPQGPQPAPVREAAAPVTPVAPIAPVQEAAPVESAKPSFLAEKALHDAKKRAAQIVMEGEAQAERKVQEIYSKARKTQEQADEFYEKRVAEAHKEADAILSESQRQGQELLKEARTLSESLREDVDGYIQSLKKKARIESDEIIADGKKQAEALKAEAIAEGHEKARKDSESLISLAREEAAKIMDKIQGQAKELEEKLKSDSAALAKLGGEIEAAEKNLSLRRADIEAATEKGAELEKALKKTNSKLDEMTISQEMLAERNKIAEEALSLLIDKQTKLNLSIQDLESRRVQLNKEAETQKVLLTEKFEKEKAQIAKMEEQRNEEVRLEFAKKMQKMEQDLLNDIILRKASLVREIHGAVEKEVVQLVDVAKWRNISVVVEERIKEAFDGKMATISQSSASTAKPVDLLKKRSNENYRWATGGAVVALLAFFVGENVLDRVRRDQTPMQTRVKNEAKQRKEDLDKRRFNPAQTEGLKETYTDSVIYTRQFVEIYLDQDFQQRLYKAMSQYLLKTWRLEEERSLQVLAAANALVKELIDKKEKIHPDFVKEGLEKMHTLETETLSRMKEILGSEVRLESFRRFEREFYQEEVRRRRVAQH